MVTAAVAAAAIVAGVAAGIAVLRPSDLPVITLTGDDGSQGAPATSDTTDDGGRADLSIWNPVEHRFVLADSARLAAGEAAAWQISPPPDLNGAATQLSRQFGLGDVQASPWDDSSLSAGATDGSGPSLWVGPTGEWYYSAPGPLVEWDCTAGPGRPAGGGDEDVATPDVTDLGDDDVGEIVIEEEDCEAPTPPTGVPSASEARQLAEELFAGFALPGEATITEATADEWGAWVYGGISIGGVPSDLTVSASWGADGQIVFAGGSLSSVVPIGDYPTIDSQAAVARLQDQSLSWTARSGMEPAELIDDPAIDEPAIDEPAIDEPPSGEVEVVTVTLVAIERSLMFHLDVEGSLWLVPGYRFADSEGGSWQVLAVDDGYVQTGE